MLVMVCGCVHCGGGQTNSSTELFVRKKAERDAFPWFVGIARVQLPQQSCL